MMPLLHIENMSVGFQSADGYVPAVDCVSFDILDGQSVALVGESGSGKSVSALSILRLLETPPACVKADAMRYADTEILRLPATKMRQIRGKDISMIFQEPMTSLNPLIPVGFQIAETVRLHQRHANTNAKLSKKEAMAYAITMLAKVGIPDPEVRAAQYAHQMSGGMRQRIMIAIALSCNPRLLIADEPTTALDVTVQAQILDLIRKLQTESNMAMLLITHNLGIVAEMAETVMIMYAGQIVEQASTEMIFTHPLHPYTQGLLLSLPSVESKTPELYVIAGTVPNPMFYPSGCRFHPRCLYACEKCRAEQPELCEIAPGHKVRCFYPLETVI